MSRIILETGRAAPPVSNRVRRSRAYKTPTMSSRSSPVTGIRERPHSSTTSRARSVSSEAAIVTISVRGTITSRTMPSVNSSTEEINSSSSLSWESKDTGLTSSSGIRSVALPPIPTEPARNREKRYAGPRGRFRPSDRGTVSPKNTRAAPSTIKAPARPGPLIAVVRAHADGIAAATSNAA